MLGPFSRFVFVEKRTNKYLELLEFARTLIIQFDGIVNWQILFCKPLHRFFIGKVFPCLLPVLLDEKSFYPPLAKAAVQLLKV